MRFWFVILAALTAIGAVLLFEYGGCEPGKIQAMSFLECER